MSEPVERESAEAADQDVWSAVAALEQIVEAMPDDHSSLAALVEAYEEVGDHTRSLEHALRLGELLLRQGELAAASELAERLSSRGHESEDLARFLARVEQTAAGGAPQGKGGAAAAEDGELAARMVFNMADELSLAWELMEAELLTEEEYSGVVQDLAEMSVAEALATSSVLHVLEARSFKRIDRVVEYLTGRYGTPVVSLSSFDLQPAATSLLPIEFATRRGALAFDSIGGDALVVVMNPSCDRLREDVRAIAKRDCHFFLALPGDFDKALHKVSGREEEPGEKPEGE